MKQDPRNFKPLSRKYLKDDVRREVLWNSTATANSKRTKRVGAIEEWSELRRFVHDVKAHVMDNLDVYLERFTENAGQRGIKVFHADTANSACRYIADLALRRGITDIVKSKSMATEEIELNDYLAERNMNVVETDLGEYIAQIAGQKPSHIVGPVIHLSRKDVGGIYSGKFGIPYTEKAEEITVFTRKILRKAFLEAEMGVSGVNFGLADEGKIAVVENEGNARMSTGLPPVHVAVMGMEKLIPSQKYLPPFMKALTASATGQAVSNYLNIIGGPAEDGPDEIHVVILDNGRSDILADPRYRPALYCLRCGACLNTCAVYRRVSGHSYGWVYPGPIGSIITPLLKGKKRSSDLPFASSLCGKCTENCPVEIPIHELLLELRSDISDIKISPVEETVWRAWLGVNSNIDNYERAGRALRLLQKAFPGNTLPVPGWSKTRDFPRAAGESFHDLWPDKNEE